MPSRHSSSWAADPEIGRARADLGYIRQALEQAGVFTAISGEGMALVGVIGLAASLLSWLRLGADTAQWQPAYTREFLVIWAIAVAAAVPVALLSLYWKARKWRLPLGSGPTRRALRSMAPGWIAAAVVTGALLLRQETALLPGFWLLLDGLALLGAATFSVAPVRWMGRSLAVLGVLALFLPTPRFTLLCLALGFGALHLGMGLHLARSHARPHDG